VGDEAPIQHSSAEAVLVERSPEDRLMHEPKVPEAEARRQKLETDRRVVELSAHPLHRHPEDLGVVEGKRQRLAGVVERLDGSPGLSDPRHREAGQPRLGTGRGPLERRGLDQCVEGHRDHPGARVASRVAE
jgi:hypothetical protein